MYFFRTLQLVIVYKPASGDISSVSSLHTRALSHSAHLTLVCWVLRLVSLHWSLFFRESTCSRLRDTSFTKLSSTRRVISNMAALKTVSMTPDSCDWNECMTSDILTSNVKLIFLKSQSWIVELLSLLYKQSKTKLSHHHIVDVFSNHLLVLSNLL